MQKSIKYTSSVSMWLAVTAIWAHMIIPHDHHFVETFTSQAQSCPASHHQSGDTSGFPLHCHAFNDLTSEEARFYHISQNTQDNYIALSSFSDDSFFELQVSCVKIIDLQKPFLNLFALELSLLRAPPSLA